MWVSIIISFCGAWTLCAQQMCAIIQSNLQVNICMYIRTAATAVWKEARTKVVLAKRPPKQKGWSKPRCYVKSLSLAHLAGAFFFARAPSPDATRTSRQMGVGNIWPTILGPSISALACVSQFWPILNPFIFFTLADCLLACALFRYITIGRAHEAVKIEGLSYNGLCLELETVT